MSETVTGYIDHIIFRNEDNGYTVMVLKDAGEEEELTCVGTFPSVSQGMTIEATGFYTPHPVYGKQFQVQSFLEKMPEDAPCHGTVLRFRGDQRYRRGPCARIVRRFGEDTIRIVEEEPERLAEVKGISEKKAQGDCGPGNGKGGYEKGHDVSSEIRDFPDSGSKDLSKVQGIRVYGPSGKPLPPGRGYQRGGI